MIVARLPVEGSVSPRNESPAWSLMGARIRWMPGSQQKTRSIPGAAILARIAEVESETEKVIAPLGQAEIAPAAGIANETATDATKTATDATKTAKRTRRLADGRSWRRGCVMTKRRGVIASRVCWRADAGGRFRP